MKKSLILLAFFSLLLGIQSCIVVQEGANSNILEYRDFQNWQTVPFSEKNHSQDSGTKRVYIVNFNKIILDVPMAAEIIPTRRQSRVEISAPTSILNRLLVEKDRDFLSLRLGNGSSFYRPEQVQLRIYVDQLMMVQTKRELFFPEQMVLPQLDILAAHHIEGDFRIDHLSIETLENGSYTGIVRASQLILNARNGSSMEIYGRVGKVKAHGENLATIDGKGLNAEVVNLHAAQDASLIFSASQCARAQAFDNAKIVIFGNTGLATDFMKTGNGQITLY